MRTRVEVKRSGRPIRPIARPCCNVTTGRGCRTTRVECRASEPAHLHRRRRHFCSPLHYGLDGTDVLKAECEWGFAGEGDDEPTRRARRVCFAGHGGW